MKSPLTQLEQLVVNSKSRGFLKEISKWAFFFSILGFLNIVLLIVVAVLMSTIYAPLLDMLAEQQGVPYLGLSLTVTYLAIALISIIPVLYLFKFSRKMKEALATKSDATLADAFGNLKSHFKFIGVLTIISISLYLLVLIFSIVTGAFV
jgi:hypothetical protein